MQRQFYFQMTTSELKGLVKARLNMKYAFSPTVKFVIKSHIVIFLKYHKLINFESDMA